MQSKEGREETHCLRKETLPDHPPEGDTRQAVRRVVRHGAATDV